MSVPLPLAVLVLVALAAAALVAIASIRLTPTEGVTAAAAATVEEATTELTARRPWLRRRLDPAQATGLALTVALVMTVAGGVILGVLALLVRSSATLRSLDRGTADWGHEHATHLSTRLLWLVTDLGDWPVVPVVAIVAVAYALYRERSRFVIPFLFVVMLGDELVTLAVKDAVDRARPTLNPIAATLGPSFPSGHSSTAASCYAALALVLSRGGSAHSRALLAGAAAGIAVGVAISRVLLDVHWLSDEVAGLGLGWAWFAVCAIAFGGRLLRFGTNAEQLASKAPPRVAAPRSSA